MTKYREILRLRSLEFNDRNTARSCSVSRNTVRRVTDKADELSISWPLDFGMIDGALEELLFPKDKSATDRRLPDYHYIRKELLRNGVTKKLLWMEYSFFAAANRSAKFGKLPSGLNHSSPQHFMARHLKSSSCSSP